MYIGMYEMDKALSFHVYVCCMYSVCNVFMGPRAFSFISLRACTCTHKKHTVHQKNHQYVCMVQGCQDPFEMYARKGFIAKIQTHQVFLRQFNDIC
jgi:hypothetical protein